MIPLIIFDRLSLVILWNGACDDCVPIIEELSELGAEHGVPCYGVAVMVGNIDAIAMAATSSRSKALLAAEERSVIPSSKRSRGWVTQHWFEASGLEQVPAGFIVERTGVIAWMGYPDEMKAALLRILKGEQNTKAEREKWKAKITDFQIENRRLTSDLADVLGAGNIEAAQRLIEVVERRLPKIASDRDFNALKFDALASDSSSHDAALVHYANCAHQFQNDRGMQLRLAMRVLSSLSSDKAAVAIAIECLHALEDGGYAVHGGSQEDVIARMLCCLTLTEALVRAGLVKKAKQQIERAVLLSRDPWLPQQIGYWAESEIERLRNSL
ncbi:MULTISPECIES: hypothetical protein [unclassified Sinorhizobium]|uniref:hypothetical protein n=1 Tax=unclassified Sinorhizobium TaxID=2613772 RepID=UPI0035246DA2